MKKWILIVIVAVALLGAIGLTLSSRGNDSDATAVETEAVARRRIVQTVTATGKVQPMTQVNVSADVSAKITRMTVEEGQWVEKGTLLLELDRERYVAAVESSEANLSAAQAQVNLARENMVKAEKDYERSRQLFERDLESQATLDTMYAAAEVEKARYQSTTDQVEQARAQLRQARDDLAKTTIYAPMSGTISKLNKEVGEICIGSQFQEDVIMVISNLEGMEVLVEVDENDIVLVSIGDAAEIEVDALPDVTFNGEVTEIASSATITAAGTTDQKTEFEVKVAIVDAGSKLRPGMTASTEIVTDTREDSLSVPIQSATVRTIDQLGVSPDETSTDESTENGRQFTPDEDGFVEIVWVVADGRAAARQVTTGIQSDSHIEVLDGIEEGELVVTGSYRAISRDLSDGVAVRAAGGEPKSHEG
jgi:HlyD family secretion protein